MTLIYGEAISDGGQLNNLSLTRRARCVTFVHFVT